VVFGPIDAGEDGRLLFAVDETGVPVGFWEGHHESGVVLAGEPGAWSGSERWAGGPGGLPAQWVASFIGDAGRAVRGGAAVVAERDGATVLRDPWGAVFALKKPEVLS
jgi:hypothetical protein